MWVDWNIYYWIFIDYCVIIRVRRSIGKINILVVVFFEEIEDGLEERVEVFEEEEYYIEDSLYG